MDEIKFANYGQERDLAANENEIMIYENLKQMSARDDLTLVRKSDNYVSVVIGEWDLARIKYTPRAKWIVFPLHSSGTEKHRIDDPNDVFNFSDMLSESLAVIEKYS